MDQSAQGIEFVYGLVGVVLGFLTSFAIFRSRFVAIEKDVENLKHQLAGEIKRLHEDAAREWERIRVEIRAACHENDDFRDRMDRRQREELLILASIAKRLGAQNRLTDLGSHVEEDDRL